MDWILFSILVGLILLIPTAYAGLIGAPYAPTRIRTVKKAFDEIKLSAEDLLIDLGAGDGKILLEATKRGARGRGYELSPIMWFITWVRVLGKKNISLRYQNFYKADLSDATVVFAFLMPKNMPKIRELLQKKTSSKIRYFLAYTFPLPEVEPKSVIREKDYAPLYIYDVESINRV